MEFIVLDKSYLEGASSSDVKRLYARRRLVMSGALFYELLDTSAQQRRNCFRKLPSIENPVVLFDHVGNLLQRELQTHRPCGKPSEYAIDIRFKFNAALTAEDYQLPDDAREAMQDELLSLDAERTRLIDLSESASGLFGGLLEGTDAQRSEARAEARRKIANMDWLIDFYSQLTSPEPTTPFPNPAIVGPAWARIRWLQVQLLFTLDHHVRHQGRLRDTLTPKMSLDLEHDLHDAQVLALGVMEGALATREKKLATWFRLLSPGGELVQ